VGGVPADLHQEIAGLRGELEVAHLVEQLLQEGDGSLVVPPVRQLDGVVVLLDLAVQRLDLRSLPAGRERRSRR